MLPNFLIVGAEKAGTSTLAATLSQHPGVFMCDPKEPRFFSGHTWGNGVAWYERLFEKAEGFAAIGEASPAYTWAPDLANVPRRIHETLGDIRYLYIVRDPVERMISHYRHALFWRWIPDDTPFERALEILPGIKNCSRYYFQIEQYLAVTRPSQWHVLTMEELVAHPAPVLRQVCQFLHVGAEVELPLISENVTDQKRRSPRWAEWLKPARKWFPEALVKKGGALLRRSGRVIPRPTISPDVMLTLREELAPDMEHLNAFTGRNITGTWAQ